MEPRLTAAIPWALDFIGGLMDTSEVLAVRKKAKEARQMYELCTFEWDTDLLDPNADPKSNVVHVLKYVDIMALPEFRERLGNLLSKQGKVQATVHTLEHDMKVDYAGERIREDAYLVVEFRPWRSNDTLEVSTCLPGWSERHTLTKSGICHFCGSSAC